MKDLKKRYWFITYDNYYPSGGLEDVDSTYDTIEEFEKALPSLWVYENKFLFDRIECKYIQLK